MDIVHDDATSETNIDSPFRKPYEGVEYEEIEVPLAELMVGGRVHVYREVISRNYFNIRLAGDKLVFAAGKYVGLIPVNEKVSIDVKPRVRVANLTRLLHVAGVAPRLLNLQSQEYPTSEMAFPSLLELLGEAFAESIKSIDANGVYREYMDTRRETSFPRGRILLTLTLRRHAARGIRHRVAASWHQRSADNAPNQLLKYALWHVAQRVNSVRPITTTARRLVKRLNAAYALFRGVELYRDRRFLSHPLVADPCRMPIFRAYYIRAMQLALTVIQNKGISFDNRGDDVIMGSLLLNLEEVFEAYLRNVLQKRRAEWAGLLVLDGNRAAPYGARKLLFNERPSQDATPDIVVRRVTATNPKDGNELIIEVKYKRYTVPDRSDLDQAIVYGISYRSPVVVIVHPLAESGGTGRQLLGRIGSMAVYSYAFDLAATDPQSEEEAFAKGMIEIIQSTQGNGS